MPLMSRYMFRVTAGVTFLSEDFEKICLDGFHDLDSDKSGNLDAKECLPLIQELCTVIGCKLELSDAQEFINFFDYDKNGVISDFGIAAYSSRVCVSLQPWPPIIKL